MLRHGTEVIDVIGEIGFDPGTEWGAGATSTADNTLRRLPAVCAGDADGSDDFDPFAEWEGFATNTFTNLGSHTATCVTTTDEAPSVTSITPASGASGVTLDTDLERDLQRAGERHRRGVRRERAQSGTHAAVVSGGPTTFTLDPSTDFVFNESCALVVNAAAVTDQDGNDPPDAMTASVTATFATDADTCTLPFTRDSCHPGYRRDGGHHGRRHDAGRRGGGLRRRHRRLTAWLLPAGPGGRRQRRDVGRNLRVQRRQQHRRTWAIWCASPAPRASSRVRRRSAASPRCAAAAPGRSRPSSVTLPFVRSARRPNATKACWCACRRRCTSPSISSSVGSARSCCRQADVFRSRRACGCRGPKRSPSRRPTSSTAIIGRCPQQPEPRSRRVRTRRAAARGRQHLARRRYRHGDRWRDDVHVGGQCREPNAYRVRPARRARWHGDVRACQPAPCRPARCRRHAQGGGHEPAQLLQYVRRRQQQPAVRVQSAWAASPPIVVAPTIRASSPASGPRPSRRFSRPARTSLASSKSRTTAMGPGVRWQNLVDRLKTRPARPVPTRM